MLLDHGERGLHFDSLPISTFSLLQLSLSGAFQETFLEMDFLDWRSAMWCIYVHDQIKYYWNKNKIPSHPFTGELLEESAVCAISHPPPAFLFEVSNAIIIIIQPNNDEVDYNNYNGLKGFSHHLLPSPAPRPHLPLCQVAHHHRHHCHCHCHRHCHHQISHPISPSANCNSHRGGWTFPLNSNASKL